MRHYAKQENSIHIRKTYWCILILILLHSLQQHFVSWATAINNAWKCVAYDYTSWEYTNSNSWRCCYVGIKRKLNIYLSYVWFYLCSLCLRYDWKKRTLFGVLCLGDILISKQCGQIHRCQVQHNFLTKSSLSTLVSSHRKCWHHWLLVSPPKSGTLIRYIQRSMIKSSELKNWISLFHTIRLGLKTRHFWAAKSLFVMIVFFCQNKKGKFNFFACKQLFDT